MMKQLWSAFGGLEDLRRACENLARLRQHFLAAAEGYEKVEQAIPVDQLAPLEASVGPLERAAMLRAALVIVRYFQELAPPLALEHGIAYPVDLEQMMCARLEQLCTTHLH